MFGFNKQKTEEDMALDHERRVKHDQRVQMVKKGAVKFGKGTKRTFKGFDKGSERVGSSLRDFVKQSQQESFSPEQQALQQMFGSGDKFWGLGDESSTNVRIHNDLHPSLRGDYGTMDLFGGGNPRNKLRDNGETSSLFF